MARENHNLVTLTLIAAIVVASAGGTVANAADFSLSTFDGEPFTLSEQQNKNGVLLFFFASWCAQSAAQVDPLKELVETTKEQNLKVVGVSLQEDASTIKAFVEKKGINFQIVLDADMNAARDFGVKGIPTFVGIGVDGEVVFRGHGLPEDPAELAQKLTDG